MKLGLILSNDWELQGDGSGNYYEIQHKPLQELLTTVENHGAKLTVMAEVGQQWAHQSISKKEQWAQEVVESWESLLKNTIRRKGDVQLHLHPQWLNAKYEKNGWNLDLSQIALSSLPPFMIEGVLERGKGYLDSLLRSIDPNYECLAFRGGAYCIQPSRVVIDKLLKVGIVCDTSVTKGMFHPPFFDYSDAYSNCVPWFVRSDDIRYGNDKENGLLEIPICSHPGLDSPIFRKYLSPELFYRMFYGVRIREQDRMWISGNNYKRLKNYPLRNRPFTIGKVKSIRWLLSNIISNRGIQLDYDFLPPEIFVNCLEEIVEYYRQKA